MYNGMTSSLAMEEYLGEPHSGDFDQGAGQSTSQLANPNQSLPRTQGATGTTGPVTSWGIALFIIALFIAIKFMAERSGKASEFSTVRIGFENFFIVGGMAAIFFYIAKVSVYVLLKGKGPVTQFFGAI